MENFEFTHEGKTYWYSRSMAVAAFVFFHDLTCDKWYILANMRGPMVPNENGKWNCICGYLDHNEGIKDCAYRELYEETGLKIFRSKEERPELQLFRIDDDPKSSSKQNVTFQFVGVVEFDHGSINEWALRTSFKYMEPGEVEEIRFIPVDEVGKYKWAFGHDKILKKHLLKYTNTSFKWFDMSVPTFSKGEKKRG